MKDFFQNFNTLSITITKFNFDWQSKLHIWILECQKSDIKPK